MADLPRISDTQAPGTPAPDHQPLSLLSITAEKSTPGSTPAATDNQSTVTLTPGATTVENVSVNGDNRQFAVHLPKGWDGKSPLPVLYYFNGMRPDGKPEPESFTGLSDRSDKDSFAVVYMRGSNEGNQTYNNGQKVFANDKDENAYLNKVHDTLSAQLPLDQSRQGLAGFSQGGNEVYALAPGNKWVASVQSVEGYMTGMEAPLNHPVSEQNIHALHDPIIPENGTGQVCAQADREAQAVIDAARYNGEGYIDFKGLLHGVTCDIERDHNNIEPQRTIVSTYRGADGAKAGQTTMTPDLSIYDFKNLANGTEVRQVTLNQGTHAWAGSTDHSGDIPIIGQPNEKFSASDAIAQFFLNHPLAQEQSMTSAK